MATATQTTAVSGSDHLLSVLVENHAGVLARISGMFSTRGYNIESLAVGSTHDPQVSRITIAVGGEDRVISQIIKQLRKMVDVIQVIDLHGQNHVERELMLVKVACTAASRSEIMQMCDVFRARIVDVGPESFVIEVSGSCDKNEALLRLFEPFGILEMTRTGRLALHRGAEKLSVPE